MKPAYKFFLFNSDRLPMYRDEASGFILVGDENYLKPDGEEASLIFSPIGWEKCIVKYGRNLTYWGLMRDMTAPLQFVKDGWDIIESQMWSKGYEAVAYFGVMKLDRFNLQYTYQNWYLSELNLVKYKKNDVSASVEALEGGMSKIVKAFEDTEFEIPIDDDPDKKTVLLDGMKLIGAQTWLMGTQQWLDADLVTFAPTFPTLNQEGQSTGFFFFDTIQQNINNTADYLNNSTNFFAQADPDNTGPLSLHLQGSFPLKLKKKRDQSYISIRWYVWNPTIGIASQQIHYIFDRVLNGDAPFTFEGETRQINFDRTITLNPGDQVFWYVTINAGTNTGQQSDWEIPDDGQYRADYSNKYKATYAEGFYLYDLALKVIAKMLEGQNVFTKDNIFFKSDWLKNKKDIIVTSQDSLRQIPGAVITTSWKNLFKSTRHWCSSSGVEDDKLFIELYGYVFKPQVFVDLGEVTDAEDAVSEDLLFNTIKTGGPVVDYGDVNGKYETNQEQTWKTPVTRVTAELDITTPYRRDPYGIEFARINFDGKTTTDDKSDNDVFMINVGTTINVSDGGVSYQKLFRPAYSVLTGVPDPVGIFNVELSPKRSVLNNMAIINGAMDIQMFGQLITLANAEKNKELNTEGYSTVKENADIQIGTGNVQLWKPHYLTFKSKIPKNILPIINAHQYEQVRFKVKGRTFFGFLFDGSVKAELNEVQQWKTLSTPINDLSKYNR